jgi:hypothetical protein
MVPGTLRVIIWRRWRRPEPEEEPGGRIRWRMTQQNLDWDWPLRQDGPSTRASLPNITHEARRYSPYSADWTFRDTFEPRWSYVLMTAFNRHQKAINPSKRVIMTLSLRLRLYCYSCLSIIAIIAIPWLAICSAWSHYSLAFLFWWTNRTLPQRGIGGTIVTISLSGVLSIFHDLQIFSFAPFC